jgi:hypothetical protein
VAPLYKNLATGQIDERFTRKNNPSVELLIKIGALLAQDNQQFEALANYEGLISKTKTLVTQLNYQAPQDRVIEKALQHFQFLFM